MKNLLRLHVERHRQDRSASDDVVELKICSTKKLAEELHKPSIRNLKKRSTSPLIDNN